MKITPFTVAAPLALLLGQVAIATAAETNTQVVVLRNGNVLEGQVDHLGDVYLIVTNTSEIRLPQRDIEFVAATLQDAYTAKRAKVRQGVIVDHIQLAMWCIRQEIWPQAAAELKAARDIAPRHPDIAFVERRLEVASRAAMRASQQQVQLASAEQETDHRSVELAELESLANTLPPGTLENFARHIQPILVNGCSAGGCHSTSDAREFRLNRDLLRGTANRESTLRNLVATWKVIDHDTPDYSPLLLQPSVPHGGLPRPVFAGHRQKVQEKLATWVREVTGTTPKPEPTPHREGVQLAGHDTATASAAGTRPGNEPQHFWEYDEELDQAPAASRPTPVQFGLTPKQFKPRDEFDPELFNRQSKSGASSTDSTHLE